MLLIPPDCPQSEAIHRITNSLKRLQWHTNHIFSNANQRLQKCQERIDIQLARIEVIEKKVEVLEQEMLVFHCAPKYPEVGCAGLRKPVFEWIMTNILDTQQKTSNSISEHEPVDITDRTISTLNTLKILKEGIARKKNGLFTHKSKNVDFAELRDSSAKRQKVNLTQILNPNTLQKYSPAQIDFSISLLDRLESLNSSNFGKVFSKENEVEVGFFESFDYPQLEDNDLGELIEFDLPEDLPGFDIKSLGVRSVSTLRSNIEERIPTSKNESHIEKRPIFDSIRSVKKPNEEENLIVSETNGPWTPRDHLLKDIPNASSTPTIQLPPPPPPPPPPPQAYPVKTFSGRTDLMAAIRATGGIPGAGLKSVKDAGHLEYSKQDSGEEDLMSSLTRVLAIRRRGISGGYKTSTSRSMGDVLRQQIPERSRTGSSSEEDQIDNEVKPHEWTDE